MVSSKVQKIVLGLMLTAVVKPSTAMDAFRRALAEHAGVKTTNASSDDVKHLLDHPPLVTAVAANKEADLTEVVEEHKQNPSLPAAAIVENAGGLSEAAKDNFLGKGDKSLYTAEEKTQIKLVKKAGFKFSDRDAETSALFFTTDPDFDDLTQAFTSSDVAQQQEALAYYKAVHDARTAGVAHQKADVEPFIVLQKLGVKKVTNDHIAARAQFTDGHSTVQIPEDQQTAIDINALVALKKFGNNNPSEDQFNHIKTLVTGVDAINAINPTANIKVDDHLVKAAFKVQKHNVPNNLGIKLNKPTTLAGASVMFAQLKDNRIQYRNINRNMIDNIQTTAERLHDLGFNVAPALLVLAVNHIAILDNDAFKRAVVTDHLDGLLHSVPTDDQLAYGLANLKQDNATLIEGAMNARLTQLLGVAPTADQTAYAVAHTNAADNALIQGAMKERLNKLLGRVPTADQTAHAVAHKDQPDAALIEGAMNARLTPLLGVAPTAEQAAYAVAHTNAANNALIEGAMNARLTQLLGIAPTAEQTAYAIANPAQVNAALVEGAMNQRLVAFGIHNPTAAQKAYAVTKTNAADADLLTGVMDARLKQLGIINPVKEHLDAAVISKNKNDAHLLNDAIAAQLNALALPATQPDRDSAIYFARLAGTEALDAASIKDHLIACKRLRTGGGHFDPTPAQIDRLAGVSATPGVPDLFDAAMRAKVAGGNANYVPAAYAEFVASDAGTGKSDLTLMVLDDAGFYDNDVTRALGENLDIKVDTANLPRLGLVAGDLFVVDGLATHAAADTVTMTGTYMP
jgi:hypothetical protein